MKKKILIFMTLFILTIFSVVATTVSDTTISNIERRRVTAAVTLNQTSNATLFVSTNSNLASPLFTETATDFVLTHSFDVTGLTGNTMYFYQFNGSSNISGSYNSTVANFTTLQTFTGNERTIMGLFTFIFLAIIMMGIVFVQLKSGKSDVTEIVVLLSVALLLAIFISQLITSLLAS